MLKSLISLFAEKFLTNRRGWVSSQSYPSTTRFISVQWNGQEYQYYTAPHDGTLCISTQGSAWVRIYSDDNTGRNILQNNDGEFKAVTNVASKGEKMVINVGLDGIKLVQIWFIPANGSS